MVISRLVRMDAPLIAVVDGPAAGAGFSLACCADFCFEFASPRAAFIKMSGALFNGALERAHRGAAALLPVQRSGRLQYGPRRGAVAS